MIDIQQLKRDHENGMIISSYRVAEMVEALVMVDQCSPKDQGATLEQSNAWFQVVNALNEVAPGWQQCELTGQAAAVTTIKRFGRPNFKFQDEVQPWMLECFGEAIAADVIERNHRFLEESLELVQACGCTAEDAHKLVDYTFGRPVGEKGQEVGGVMVTLAALCLAQSLDMHLEGWTELERILRPEIVAKIRAKQASKPKFGPLP